jgi:hypothetical protein
MKNAKNKPTATLFSIIHLLLPSATDLMLSTSPPPHLPIPYIPDPPSPLYLLLTAG